VKEDIGVDVKENYVQYHIKDNDSEVWIIHDFNRVRNIALYEFTYYIAPHKLSPNGMLLL